MMKCARPQGFRKPFSLAKFLPSKMPILPCVTHLWPTSQATSTIFCTVQPCCMGVLVADVIGHGVPAALVASMVKVAVSTQCGNGGGPASIIAGLNTILCKEAHEQYVTATYLYLDTANRNRPTCGRRTSTAVVVAPQNTVLGEDRRIWASARRTAR